MHMTGTTKIVRQLALTIKYNFPFFLWTLDLDLRTKESLVNGATQEMSYIKLLRWYAERVSQVVSRAERSLILSEQSP